MVYLERDFSEADRSGRLLRYVYLEDGRMVNEILMTEGFAYYSAYPPDVKHQQRFLNAQRGASEARRGLWGVCPPVTPQSPVGLGPGCHPAYPTVCIPPPPLDLDCFEIPYFRFAVVPPDPHGFDDDYDGTGCES
jgi:micrococcal nuclease